MLLHELGFQNPGMSRLYSNKCWWTCACHRPGQLKRNQNLAAIDWVACRVLGFTFDENPEHMQVETVKGIFWPAVSHNQSRNYVLRAPALPITELPYHALAPIGSAAGKALWHVKPTRDATFDVLLCLRVPPVLLALLHACGCLQGSAHVQALDAHLRAAQRAWPFVCSIGVSSWRIKPVMKRFASARTKSSDGLKVSHASSPLWLCLQRGVFLESAISMYRDGTLAWCASLPNRQTGTLLADALQSA